MKPFLGQTVHYHPPGKPEPYKALLGLVVCIWSDTCVNLAVFDKEGRPITVGTSILYVVPGNPRPTGGHFCEAPPPV